jgi:hypothetical protein
VLEYNSRHPSDLDLSVEDGPDQGDDGSVKGARKKKKLATSRGFFQLAETVEKAKWDDEAWRRDFNVGSSFLEWEFNTDTQCFVGTRYNQVERGKEGTSCCSWG